LLILVIAALVVPLMAQDWTAAVMPALSTPVTLRNCQGERFVEHRIRAVVTPRLTPSKRLVGVVGE